MSCGSIPPSQVSNSSFYSRQSSRNVAESPDLGQAKTAVGALLAVADTRTSSFQDSSFHHHETHSLKRTSILPPTSYHESSILPSPTYNNDMSILPPSTYDNTTILPSSMAQNENSILPSRDWLDEERALPNDNDCSRDLQYQALNDSHMMSRHSNGGFYPRSEPSDDESSIHASPSSTNWKHSLMAQKQIPNTSFTQGFLQRDLNKSSDGYNFLPVVVNEDLFLDETSAPALNLSGISQSKDVESLHSLLHDDDYENDEELVDHPLSYKTMGAAAHERMLAELRIKEDLLVSTLERLQDDM